MIHPQTALLPCTLGMDAGMGLAQAAEAGWDTTLFGQRLDMVREDSRYLSCSLPSGCGATDTGDHEVWVWAYVPEAGESKESMLP
jgi:hypothetical protein